MVRVLTAGIVVGFLTGLFGAGGGFVIVPALALAFAYEMPVAIGTSLLVITVSSAERLAFRFPATGADWDMAIPFTLAGLVFVALGNVVAGHVPLARLSCWCIRLLLAVGAYSAGRLMASL